MRQRPHPLAIRKRDDLDVGGDDLRGVEEGHEGQLFVRDRCARTLGQHGAQAFQTHGSRIASLGIGLGRIDVDLGLVELALQGVAVELELKVFGRNVPRGNVVAAHRRHRGASAASGHAGGHYQTKPAIRHRRTGHRGSRRRGRRLSGGAG